MSDCKLFVYGTAESSKNYHAAVMNSNMIPVYSLEPLYAADTCDGLLLTGGGDLSPSLYGEVNESSLGIDDERDFREFALLKAFIDAHKPVFGICRGLQSINVYFGGSLWQDIGEERCKKHRYNDGVGDRVHEINTVGDSFLTSLFGTLFTVNSAHHQAIKTLADGFQIAAVSDDIIEAIQDKKRNVFALQWHPERMTGRHQRIDTVDGKIFFDYMRDVIENNKKDKE